MSLSDIVALKELIEERMPRTPPGENERLFGPEFKGVDQRNNELRRVYTPLKARVSEEIEKRLEEFRKLSELSAGKQ